jgi:small subunit ribosomal protein S4
MSKRESSKYKLDRRMGENIWGRPKSPVNRREYGPGQHGQRRKGKLSDFGVQLRAKQKLKGYYGDISEKQFRKIYDEANRMKGDTPENLIGLLESASTPSSTAPSSSDDLRGPPVRQPRPRHRQRQARQHRFYRCKPGDVVEVKEKSKQLAFVIEATQLAERDVPEYIEADHNKMVRPSFACRPCRTFRTPVVMEPNLVVEFYSR